MTFSTNIKEFSEIIARQENENTWIAGDQLEHSIIQSGFRINHQKTSMQYKTQRQSVCRAYS